MRFDIILEPICYSHNESHLNPLIPQVRFSIYPSIQVQGLGDLVGLA